MRMSPNYAPYPSSTGAEADIAASGFHHILHLQLCYVYIGSQEELELSKCACNK